MLLSFCRKFTIKKDPHVEGSRKIKNTSQISMLLDDMFFTHLPDEVQESGFYKYIGLIFKVTQCRLSTEGNQIFLIRSFIYFNNLR